MKKTILQITEFFRRPKYVHPDFIYPVTMLEIDDKAKTFHAALGISDERADKLLHLLHERIIKKEKLHVMMIEMSKECKHANELAFVAHHYGSCPAMNGVSILSAIIGNRK